MNAVAFDTLKTARALEGSGIPRAHAEAIAEQLAEGRTVDLSHLSTREELNAVRDDLKADIAKCATKDELKAEVAKLATKDELKYEIALVRADMRDLENRMMIKLGAMLVVMTGILLTAVRYFGAAH